MINLDSVVSYRSDLDATDLDGDTVMMDLEKGRYFALNSVGSSIWKELEKNIKVYDIIENLLNEYDVDREVCEKSVVDFLEGLRNAELISIA